MSEKNKTNSGHRYFYVLLTEEREVGDASKHTPQHITLIPPFEANRKDVLDVAMEVASLFGSFEVETDGHYRFGPRKNIHVVLIQPNDTLNSIHTILLEKLAFRNITFENDNFIGERFTPHIAIKSFHPELDEAKPIKMTFIAVMDKYKNIKTVISKNSLGGSK